MPTQRLVYLSQQKLASHSHSEVDPKIISYLYYLNNGYFKDINTVNWNSLYERNVPIWFSKTLIEYKFLPYIINKHIDDARDNDYYQLYTNALLILKTKAKAYKDVFCKVMQGVLKDLTIYTCGGAAAAFVSYFFCFVDKVVDDALFWALWQTLDFATTGCKALELMCDDVALTRYVGYTEFYRIKNALIYYPEQTDAILGLIGTICLRKDDLYPLFDSGCFSIVCGFLKYEDCAELADILWIISNLAQKYNKWFGPAVLAVVRKGLDSTVPAIVEYCCISIEEMCNAYDTFVGEFIYESGVLDVMGGVLVRNGENSQIVERVLNIFRAMLENGVLREMYQYYDAIASVYDQSEQNMELVSDFLLQLI